MESVTKLGACVIRILGQNPGKFTLQGTNTYLIGHSRPYILFDTGDGVESYIPLLLETLRASSAPHTHNSGENSYISDIVVSHRHHDHHGGLPSILAALHDLSSGDHVPPRIHKLPSPPVPSNLTFQTEKDGASFQSTLDLVSRLDPASFERSDSTPAPLVHSLSESTELKYTPPPDVEPSTCILKIIHTPGHTTDSISLFMPSPSPSSPSVLFSADTILGEGTVIFEDLSTYMSSLYKLQSVVSSFEQEVQVYPGHGPVLPSARSTLTTYITHRTEREDQIIALLPSEERITASKIVQTLYAAYPKEVWPAAERGVLLHLFKLENDGRVEKTSGADLSEGDVVEKIRAIEWRKVAPGAGTDGNGKL